MRRNKQKSAEFSDRCADSRSQILDWIATTPKIDLVIIANRWAAYPDNLYAEGIFDQSDGQKVLTRIEQGLDETLAEIDPHRHAILLIGDVPYPGFNVPDCALQTSGIGWRRSCPHDLNAFAEFDRPLQGILARAASGPKRIYYLDPVKAMCAPKGCPIRVNNEIIYADGHHLRQNLKPATFQELSSMLGLDEALRSATSDVPTFLHGGTPAH